MLNRFQVGLIFVPTGNFFLDFEYCVTFQESRSVRIFFIDSQSIHIIFKARYVDIGMETKIFFKNRRNKRFGLS